MQSRRYKIFRMKKIVLAIAVLARSHTCKARSAVSDTRKDLTAKREAAYRNPTKHMEMTVSIFK